VIFAGQASARTWTDSSGDRQIEAEFVRKLGDKVVVRLAGNGKLYEIPLNRLSPEDQTFVEGAGGSSEGLLKRLARQPRDIVVDTSGSDRFSAAIRSDPNNPDHYVRRGMSRLAKGDYADAEIDFSKAVQLDPKSADAYNGRGQAYAKLEKADKAHTDFNQAIELDPNLASAYQRRGDNMPALAKTPLGEKLIGDAKDKLKKKWNAMDLDNQKKTPWQPLNSTKGPMTADMLALAMKKRDYEFAEMVRWQNGYRLGIGGIGGGGVGIGVGGGYGVGSGVAVGTGVAINGPLTLYPETVYKGDPLTLVADATALNSGMPTKIGPNGRAVRIGAGKIPAKEDIASVDFYRDSNGDGQLAEDIDQYLGTDSNPQDGFSVEIPTWQLPLGNSNFFALPKGAEGTAKDAGPDLTSVADRLEEAAKEERAVAAQAAAAQESGLEAPAAGSLRENQRGVGSATRSVMKSIRKSAPEVYEDLKGVSRNGLAIDKELKAAESAPGASSAANAKSAYETAEKTAKMLADAAEKLRNQAATQSTAARGVPAYAPGAVVPKKKSGEGGPGGPGSGGPGGDGDGGYGDGDRDVIVVRDDDDDLDVRAVEYLDRDDYENAVVAFDELIEDEPDNLYYRRQRAGAHLARGGYDYAIRDYDHLVGLDTKNADLYYNRGCAHLSVGNLEKAITDFTISISLDETRNLAYTNRGAAFARQGKYPRAIDDFNTALGMNAKDGLALRNRALAYKKAGELSKYEADIVKLNALNGSE
jgi:tetratricopeptide (TPR) repeat protein